MVQTSPTTRFGKAPVIRMLCSKFVAVGAYFLFGKLGFGQPKLRSKLECASKEQWEVVFYFVCKPAIYQNSNQNAVIVKMGFNLNNITQQSVFESQTVVLGIPKGFTDFPQSIRDDATVYIRQHAFVHVCTNIGLFPQKYRIFLQTESHPGSTRLYI